MSVSINTHGALEQPTSVRLTTTATTQIYPSTTMGTTCIAIAVANETASPVIVRIDRFDPVAAVNWNTFRRSIPANDTVIWTDFPIKMRTGHIIRATADTANAITVSVAVVLDAAAAAGGSRG